MRTYIVRIYRIYCIYCDLHILCVYLQIFLRGDPESFLYNRSVRNQTIEAVWSRLKKFKFSWRISFFKSLEKDCLYKPEFDTHKEVLIFCFLSVIQNELNEFVLRRKQLDSHQMHLEETQIYFFTVHLFDFKGKVFKWVNKT